MLPETVQKRVEALGTLSRQGTRMNGLYRLMESPALWLRASAKVHANAGATTRGVDPVTMDGFAMERVENSITLLKEHRYCFRPVRRVSIPKSNGTSRPLGVPSGDDKLVQEVVRALLERKIDDRRFINLIKTMLKAGSVEDGVFHRTSSGAPQGGMCSPVSAHIVLHELDQFMEAMQVSSNQGKWRAANPLYKA
jgi:retron-type reverse transcriptase